MKNFIYLFFILILIFSCNDKKIKKNIKYDKFDSVGYYLNNFNKENLSISSKKNYNNLAFKNLKEKENTLINRNNNYAIISNYFVLNDWNNYKKSSKLLLKYSIDSNDTISLVKAYRSLGNYYNNVSVLDSSYYYYVKAEKIYKIINDYDGYSIILLKKGIIQYNINDFIGANLTLSISYNYAKKINDNYRIYGILNQLGLVSNQIRDYNKSIEYLNLALQTVKENSLQTELNEESICLSNIGLVYENLKNYKKAIFYYEKCLTNTNLKNESPLLYSNIIDNLSSAKLKSKKLETPFLFQEALKIRDSINEISAIIGSNIHLSEYYDAIKDTTFSIRYSKKALQLSKDSQNPFDIVLSLKQAAAVDKKNASAYTSDYIRISDSLQNVERINLDRFARIQLETDELIKENTFLTERNKRIIGLVFAFGSIFLILFYSRTQFLKNKYLLLEQSQQRANEDIYRLVISEQDSIDQGKNLEKKRIAKELHDGVLGRLFGLRLNLDMLNSRDDDNVSKDRKSFLNELQLIEQDIREISHELSREKIALINNFLSLTNALFENQVKIGKAKLKTEIDSTINWDLLSNSTRINLYRILQEALQNVNKYAKAKNISISFKKDINGNLILSIFDDGIGFNVEEKSKGIGLTNIFSRIDESNGTIKINSERKKGTSILIVIPLESKTIKF